MEGYLFGIPAIAFSQVEKGWSHLDAAARVARELVQQVIAQGLLTRPAPFLLNVNIPNRPYEALGPLQVCRLGRRHAAESVISQPSPRGDTMYWIGAAGPARDGADGTDFHATAQGCIAVTPLQVDLTDHDALGDWTQTARVLSAKA
jgi:5'-nucleotidase